MNLNFELNQPIYQQIIDIITLKIANGEYNAGTKILSVRDFAKEYGVNPNTVQKALSMLEELGFLYSEGTSGRYVTKDCKLIEELKTQIPKRIIENFILEMEAVGIKQHAIIDYISPYLKITERGETND